MWSLPADFISGTISNVASIISGFMPILLLLIGLYLGFFIITRIIHLAAPKAIEHYVGDEGGIEELEVESEEEHFYREL